MPPPPVVRRLPKGTFAAFAFRLVVLVLVIGVTPVPADVVQQATPPGPVHQPVSSLTNAPTLAPLSSISPASPPSAAAQQSAAATEDIRDIRGPISIPYEWLWAAYVAAGLAVIALAYGLWRFLRRRRAARAKLPYEIALEKLDAARALMTSDTVREYAFTASEIIRVYIEQSFGEKAAHRTTEEFLNDLLQQTGTPLATHRRRLEDFLGHCDLSKFARWQFSEREMESMHASARDFVLDTKPQLESGKAVSPSATTAPTQLVAAK
jgi:hypothetical protein